MSDDQNTKQTKYFLILVKDEGCPSNEDGEYLPPADTAEQWDAENSFDLAMGNTVEGILELTQEQFEELQRRDGVYVPE